ncbi:hypothetical protein [Mucilaginibacter sp. 44-25]|uniref:hypothetical protein n=1 Tax=Mucilaginibacter sp. 44-25 TaxID=1895794 RepID=UPI00095AEC2C|nr:hypothetical protein [Mucilaginibacter sp. 44-25]OJW13887.1 MAG: hypothetical protein BGO48_03985 [Mucilaginibacter sp. 44-25]
MKNPILWSAVLGLMLTQGCTKANSQVEVVTPPKDTVKTNPQPVVNIPSATYDLSLLSKATLFADASTTNDLVNQTYRELSGLAAGRTNAGLLYTHEDSGNGPEVYITDAKGRDLGRIILDGVNNRDWEDIVCGPGPDATKNYIYVAEIGDNDVAYRSVSIYRFVEPDLTGANAQTVKHVTPEIIPCVYPGGALNAETLMIDPLTKDLYIATKQVSKSTLYVARYPQSTNSTTTLTPLANFPFDLLTAGDISADGSEIVIRNTGQIWYWKRQANESVVNAMLRQPQDAPYGRDEPQGESICFSAIGDGYFTISETKKSPAYKNTLSFYKKK